MNVLHVERVSKTFPGQVALREVSVDVKAGTVHALVGQNGSGKSTLIKILAGYHSPDPGASATVAGRSFRLGSAAEARASGIRFVHQDLALVGSLNAVENFALTQGYGVRGLSRIRWRDEVQRAYEAIAALGHDIDLRRPVNSLTIVERTVIAIARAVSDRINARVIVLDEPTAPLAVEDVTRLFDAIRELSAGGLAVLFVTHQLDEVMDLADQISVLRDGQIVRSAVRGEVTSTELAELIVGHAIRDRTDARQHVSREAPVRLSIRHLATGALRELTVDVSAGELVGVAGLDGSGRDLIGPILSGQVSGQGTVSVDGQRLMLGSPLLAMRAGLVYVPRDRALAGLIPAMNVRENITISDLGSLTRWSYVSRQREHAEAQVWINRLHIAATGDGANITLLSGGNQQKVLLARALRLKPKVLVLDEPTQGVDIGAREEVHRLVEQAASDMAVLVMSSDTGELARLCHRVLVMRRGVVAVTLHRGDGFSAAQIDHAQLGAQPPDDSKMLT